MISKNISYNEAVNSKTALKLGINNIPNAEQLNNMQNVAERVFQPIREHFNVPIYISSFFRSEALNKAIGGSKTSQHCKGEAMDLDADVFGGITNAQIFNYIKDNLEFDQLIWEFGTDKNPGWVHVSYSQYQSRHKILKAIKNNGKTIYQNYVGI
jgi:zinc D-Ala-D-Ala carboxypeptidase